MIQRFADMASIALDNAALVNSYKGELLERLQAEEALQISEVKYRSIFEAASDGIYIHDLLTGGILDVNQKACELYGYTREEMLSRQFRIIGTGESPFSEIEARQWLMRAAAGEPQLFEWRNKHKDGYLIWVEIHLNLKDVAVER